VLLRPVRRRQTQLLRMQLTAEHPQPSWANAQQTMQPLPADEGVIKPLMSNKLCTWQSTAAQAGFNKETSISKNTIINIEAQYFNICI
jgi:hypothetical protein